jgi:hypothetical protein
VGLRSLFDVATRAFLVVAVAVGALALGTELKSARELASGSQAASAAGTSPTPEVLPSGAAPVRLLPTPVATINVVPEPTGLTSPPVQPKRPAHSPPPTPTMATGTAVLTGRVTAGGKPVRRAELRVYRADDFARGPTPVPPDVASAVTDDEGRYALTVPYGTYRVGAWLQTHTTTALPGFWWVTWYGDALAIGLARDLEVRGDVSGIDIAMLPTAQVSGRVVGRDGVGVGGAEVLLFRGPAVYEWDLGYARTDASGAFRLEVAAMPMKLMARAFGIADVSWAIVDLSTPGPLADPIVIDRGHALSGILRDGDGQPLADTDFAVHAAPDRRACPTSCSGRTDSEGRYAVTVPTGTFRFVAGPWNAPTHESEEVHVSGDSSADQVLMAVAR